MLKFISKPVIEHEEVPLADEGRLEALVEHWNERGTTPQRNHEEGKADYVISVGTSVAPVVRQAQLTEIVSLVRHQGDRVVGSEILQIGHANPRTLLGKGTAQAIAERARAAGAAMLVLDAELTPSQTRNLEDVAGIPICDREAIILNVFLRHARSRRARIHVETAQLEYLRPRIRGLGLDMDQQTGGMARARGPGETASELLARKLDSRLAELRRQSEKLETSGTTQRQGRSACARIALVGYTNSGKTTLMNALAGAYLSARDRPFETLDTTSRALSRHGRDVLLSDTVGVIRRLPGRLLASFQSTLEEVREASLLAIVIDASDPELDLQRQTTLEILRTIGADKVPRYFVFNKVDRITCAQTLAPWHALADGAPWSALCAHDMEAVSHLRENLLTAARVDEATYTLFVPYSAPQALAMAYRSCRILETEGERSGVRLRLECSVVTAERIKTLVRRRQ
jgi:GTPase